MPSSVYNPDGSIRTTLVSGSTRTGLYAADGSINIVLTDTANFGPYHPCGALRVNPAWGSVSRDPSGAFYRNRLFGSYTPPLYTGQVATRCFIPDSIFASTTGWNCRTAHIARDTITSLQVVFANWRVTAGTGDVNQGGTQTVTASIEYPAGTYTRVKFSGANSVVIADGANAVSDSLTINIPRGATFWTKRYQVNAVGIQFNANSSPAMNLAMGDAVNNSNVDETLTTTANTSGGTVVAPAAIIAQTRLPSIGIIGSSRVMGFKDLTVDSTGDTGYCRLFGDSFAYSNMACSGDTMQAVANNSAKRLALLKAYCTHLWIDPGLNDINAARTPAQVIADINTIAGTWGDRTKVIVNNEGPYTTSTDSWATTANQTASGLEASRVSLNSLIAAMTGLNQIVSVAPLVTANGSSFAWAVNGVANKYTPDGLHESTDGVALIKASNPLNAVQIR